MEKYLIDYEIDREKEAEKEPEKGPVMDHDERKEEKSQEEKEREEKARKAQNRANAAWQAKEYEQINVKLPRGLKRLFCWPVRKKAYPADSTL